MVLAWSLMLAPVATVTAGLAQDEPTPVRLVQSGGGHASDSPTRYGWGFVLQNDNLAHAATGIAYQVALFAGDRVARTATGSVDILFPGQRMGIAGRESLSEQERITGVAVQLDTRAFSPIDEEFRSKLADNVVPVIPTANVVYRAERFSSTVTGQVVNPFDATYRLVRVNAILYGADDAIVGGGFTYLNFINGLAWTPAEVTVVGGRPLRQELYVQLPPLR